MGIWKWSHAGLFVGGMIFATKGIEALTSKAAHKAYVNAAALGLRCRDEVMESITAVREGCEDIYAEAVERNEDKDNAVAAETLVIEDKSEAAEPVKKTTKKKAK